MALYTDYYFLYVVKGRAMSRAGARKLAIRRSLVVPQAPSVTRRKTRCNKKKKKKT